MIAVLLFVPFLVMLTLSVPIGIALGLASTIALIVSGSVNPTYIAQGLVTSIDSFPLMAVPFFVLAGDLMGHGGLSKRLLAVGQVIFGRYSGGLAIIAVVTCMFFAAISGSGPATVAAVGAIMMPAMARDGYRPAFSGGLIASAGSLGVIIPPSIPMVIYSTSANVSVTKMFMAGVVPGAVIGLALILYAWFQARREGIGRSADHHSVCEIGRTVWEAKWALMVPVLILGGIYGGVFTPTEASAVGVIYGLIVGLFIYRELKLRDLYHIFAASALTSATIMLIVGAATIFGRVLTIERIPVMMAEAITSWVSSPLAILALVNVFLLVIGTFMETLAAIIILTPILLPIATAAGVDPIHFGIVMIANLAIGMVTPPVGVNLFVASRVGEIPLEKVVRAALPFLAVMLIVLAAITYIPALSLTLPELFGL
jgi:TRAP transporter, DctM subunit